MMETTMDQVRELAERYVECGLGHTSSGRFLQGIVKDGIMPRGRGIDWLNDLIKKGNPQDTGPLVKEIEGLISRTDRDDTKSSLAEILRKVRAGWTLTEHAQSTLNRLRQQVNEGKPDVVLEARQSELMDGLVLRKRFHSSYYWAGRPAISRRIDDILHRWSTKLAISPDDWEYIRENFKGIVADFEGDRHPPGSLRWDRNSTPITIMGHPKFTSRGDVVIETLSASGGVRESLVSGLLIRAPR